MLLVMKKNVDTEMYAKWKWITNYHIIRLQQKHNFPIDKFAENTSQ